MRICATEFIWGTSSQVTTTHSGFLETLLRAWYGRRRPGAVETLGDLFVERDSASKILPRDNHTTQGTQTEKKSNKSITVLKIILSTLYSSLPGYSLGR